jgi:hypothetical protein
VSTKGKLEIIFNGILYGTVNNNPTLRNNDARRLYGKISYELYGVNIGNIVTPIVPVEDITNTNGVVTVFEKERNTDYIAPFIYDTYTYALTKRHESRRSADNIYGQKFLTGTADLSNARKVFYIDALSYPLYNPGAPAIVFKPTIKIGSAYKSCDICTDFTWDASMINSVTEDVLLPGNIEDIVNRARRTRLNLSINQFGPYRKDPVRQDQQRNFIGPQIPTYIQFTTKRINE